jgi:hypothetical protein
MRVVQAKTWAALGLAALLSACATQAPQPLYVWGDYQRQLYASLKGDGDPQAQLQALNAHAEKVRGKGAALPPGFRAHQGFLNLQLGRPDEARQLFEAEKASFPEAQPYMDFLLKRMSQPAKTGA